jgi:putative oxidoreductase
MKFFTTTLGRILFALSLGLFGLFHLIIYAELMNAIVPSWFPWPIFWIYVTGIVLIVASVFIIGNIKGANIVSLILAIMMLLYILVVYIPILLTYFPGAFIRDEQTIMISLIGFFKDLAITGAAFTYAGILGKEK